ncbi:hypothetical protein GCM10007385_26220 [Tateyamaria omphalii]|uniref:hypothetical protein n=1 Tax=Tateyamaria omphalii TaxID=299262 RepID=UPI0016785524|nr:hypothetical protein [Tateyamaria omphalii]GGX56288.1 hypothetical protein GCM10007385_26220 [Tateyamaria omphalii]
MHLSLSAAKSLTLAFAIVLGCVASGDAEPRLGRHVSAGIEVVGSVLFTASAIFDTQIDTVR